jgi:hypothetical protein
MKAVVRVLPKKDKPRTPAYTGPSAMERVKASIEKHRLTPLKITTGKPGGLSARVRRNRVRIGLPEVPSNDE